MADSLHGKNSRQMAEATSAAHLVAARKISAPAGVCRTTSETMRLPAVDQSIPYHHQSLGNNSNSLPQQQQQQVGKKTSSFQITSVTVGCRMSNDGGEDSNDDLDESHTEDNNSVDHSRITDVETPTYNSEDNNFSALSTAPVIPTSSQYGLAIVPSNETGGAMNNSTSELHHNNISVTENDIINHLVGKQETGEGRNERFKVVKIESTEPFKRGRWTCMDYLDQTSVNQPTVINQSKSDPNEVCISYGVTDTGIVVQDTTNTKPSVIVEDQQKENGLLTSPEPGSMSVTNTASPQTPQFAVNQQQQQQYFQTPPPASQQQQPQQPQGATLPSNLQQQQQQQQTQNMGTPQSLPQGSISLMTPQQQQQQANSPMVVTPIHPKDEQQQTTLAGPGSLIAQQQQPPTTPQQQQVPAPTDQQQQMIHIQQTTPQQQSTGTPSMAFHQQQQQQPPDKEQDSMVGLPVVGGACTAGVAAGQSIGDPALLESLVTEVTHNPEDLQTREDSESMSGTSAVAIDNKIEQAMDLVKSHLMFAVREEVEVLKEKIAELMDRINQLEAENSILKAHATSETLAQLSQVATKLPPINNSGTGQQ